ncbi:MAG: hypothetical protein R6V44_06000 [Paracoccaceae bacterium]
MNRHIVTDAEIRILEADARRMRAEAFRNAGAAFSVWIRGLFAGAETPKGGRTA